MKKTRTTWSAIILAGVLFLLCAVPVFAESRTEESFSLGEDNALIHCYTLESDTSVQPKLSPATLILTRDGIRYQYADRRIALSAQPVQLTKTTSGYASADRSAVPATQSYILAGQHYTLKLSEVRWSESRITDSIVYDLCTASPKNVPETLEISTDVGDKVSLQLQSYLLKKLFYYLFICGVRIFVFDPEAEYEDLTRNLGGSVVDCAAGRVKINPFEVRRLKTMMDEDDKDDQDDLPNIDYRSPMFFQHLSWLADFFQVLFPKLGDLELKALMILTQEMYAAFGITEKTDFTKLSSNDYPTFSDLYNYTNKLIGKPYKMISAEIIDTLLLYLKDCSGGSLGQLLDGHTNISNSRLIDFSMRDLLEGSKERTQAVIFNIATYCWNIVCLRESWVLQEVDEGYLFMENPITARYLRNFAKRGRKYKAMLYFATQQLMDCFGGERESITTAIVNNSAFKCIFYPEKIDLSFVQEKLKLTDGEARCISSPNKTHCLLKAGSSQYSMYVGSLPCEKALFGKAGGV